MNAQSIKLASGIIVLLTLCGFIGRSAVRINRIEHETEKVSSIEKHIQIMNLYMKLQDPTLYNKAEQLAN
jgi:hypothetical protein